MRTTLAAITLLLASRAVLAQTVDPAEYMPLGTFNQWFYAEEGDPDDTTLVRVKNTSMHRGVVRYLLEFPKINDLKDATFLFGKDGDLAYLYAARITGGIIDDDLEAERLEFHPPLLVADGTTTLGGPAIVSDVDTTIEVKREVNEKDVDAKVRVRGTVESRWFAGTALTTPAVDFPAAAMAIFRLTFDLNLKVDDKYIELDLDLFRTIDLNVARHAGPVLVTTANGKRYLLQKAILPGYTLGEGLPEAPADVTSLELDTPGILVLNGRTDAETTDGYLSLTDLDLVHTLDGKLELLGMLEVPGSGAPARQFTMTGKAKALRTGGAKVKLKGKFAYDGTPKPVSLELKQTVTAATTTLTLAYRAGKDELGNRIEGELALGVAPLTGDSVRIALRPAVDRDLEPNLAKRQLGAEGLLTVGDADFPVALFETLKAKEGKPDSRKYTISQAGTDGKDVTFSATSTGAADWTLGKLKLKLLGVKRKPAPGDVAVTVE